MCERRMKSTHPIMFFLLCCTLFSLSACRDSTVAGEAKKKLALKKVGDDCFKDDECDSKVCEDKCAACRVNKECEDKAQPEKKFVCNSEHTCVPVTANFGENPIDYISVCSNEGIDKPCKIKSDCNAGHVCNKGSCACPSNTCDSDELCPGSLVCKEDNGDKTCLAPAITDDKDGGDTTDDTTNGSDDSDLAACQDCDDTKNIPDGYCENNIDCFANGSFADKYCDTDANECLEVPQCSAHGHCMGFGLICDIEKQKCTYTEDCSLDHDACPADKTCLANKLCVPQNCLTNPSICTGTQICDTTNGQCKEPDPNQTGCANDNTCQLGQYCDVTDPSKGECTTGCRIGGTECGADKFCNPSHLCEDIGSTGTPGEECSPCVIDPLKIVTGDLQGDCKAGFICEPLLMTCMQTCSLANPTNTCSAMALGCFADPFANNAEVCMALCP